MVNPLICAACIIGNEVAVIERFIRSFSPSVDHFIFVEAVGTELPDNSDVIARRICGELGVTCEFSVYFNKQKWPHVDDFSAARNQAWALGKNSGAKYLIWADADDLLPQDSIKGLRDAATEGKSDVFIVPYEVRGKAQIIYRERMVKNDGCSRWAYPVHELLEFTRDVSYSVLKSCRIIHAPLPDKKYEQGRNRRILDYSVKDGARHLFFMALEFLELGKMEIFRKHAAAAMAHPDLGDVERHELLVLLAQQEVDGERGQTRARDYAAQAFALMPDRREALALLTCYALIDGRKDEAFSFAKIMASISIPRKAYWTLNREWYTWKGFYLLTQTMRAIGKEEEALKLESEQFQKNGALFSICHPTYLRPEQALAVRDLYLSRANNPMAIEYIFGIHHDDKASLELLSGFRHTITTKEGCFPNTLEPMKASSGKFIMVIADDLFPSMGWDEQILKVVPDMTKLCVLNFNDLLRTDGHLCHAFMTRPWLETILADPWPGTGIYSDNEFTHRARKAAIVVDAPEVIFEHRHVINGKAPMDATYADQNQPKNYDEGRRLLMERNPDYPPIKDIDPFTSAVQDLMYINNGRIRFLQIGAHDGVTLDPLRPFIEKYPDWSGMVMEPQPIIFKRLVSGYHHLRDRVKCLNAAIAPTQMVKLYTFKPSPFLPDHATMLASLNRDALLHNGHGYKGEIEELNVPGMTFKTVCEDFDKIDLLQIDTEGYDFEILKMLEKLSIRPKIIRFESAMLNFQDKSECEKMLHGMGYQITNLGIDTMASLKQ